MAWLQQIKGAVAEGILSSIESTKLTLMAEIKKFVRFSIGDSLDILCIGLVGYTVFIAIKIMMNDKKYYTKAFDKTFFVLMAYYIVRVMQKSVILWGGGGS